MASIIEFLREQAVESLFKTSTVKKCWSIWKSKIDSITDGNCTGHVVFDMGDHLSEIFRSTSTSGRGQGSVSGGGTAWESLVCWYMNLCLIGTRVVVVKQKRELIPESIRNAIQVNYGSFPSNTESDLLVIVFPDIDIFTEDISDNAALTNEIDSTIPIQKHGKFNCKEIMDFLLDMHIHEFELGIIQCKTNWNDNAQIPMLWDMVYSSKGFSARNISLGSNGRTIQNFKKFTYSFVTVPTSRGPFKPNSTSVRRVHNISGGNYWGEPTGNAVAFSIKEIFLKNYRDGIPENFINHLTSELKKINTEYSYLFPEL